MKTRPPILIHTVFIPNNFVNAVFNMSNANVILNESLKTLHELLADILVCIETSGAVSCHCSRVTLATLCPLIYFYSPGILLSPFVCVLTCDLALIGLCYNKNNR